MATATENEKNLTVAFVQFLREQISHAGIGQERLEALEIGIQCLEKGFGLDDGSFAFQPVKPLLETFTQSEAKKEAISEINTDALKDEGNALMKDSKYEEAVKKYTEAIRLRKDPVYFCNRAAAYCRMEKYDLATQDCRTALSLDPNYSKAWGRMGLALSCQNRFSQAIDAYKKAIELDPSQESYKNNLKIAEEKLNENRAGQNPLAAFMNAGGSVDPFAMLSNPHIMDMAQSLMQDQNVRNLMGQMINSEGGFSQFANLGQQMAEQMQQMNPELVEQLRRNFQNPDNNEGSDDEANE